MRAISAFLVYDSNGQVDGEVTETWTEWQWIFGGRDDGNICGIWELAGAISMKIKKEQIGGICVFSSHLVKSQMPF